MVDITALAGSVVEEIKATDEYKEFQRLLLKVKEDPALYNRLNELRRRNFNIQMSDSDDALDMMDALTNEFEDVINMELATEFLEAEAAFCGLMQEFYSTVTDGLEFD